MLIYLILIFSFYFGFLLLCIAGWHKFVHSKNTHSEVGQKFVSVVVAVRNEEHSITPLLDSLRFQDLPYNQFEIIFVNDHSTDNSEPIISGWIKENPHMRSFFIYSKGNGKKQALTEGISQAKGEIILTTDADCQLPTDWISRMVMSFHARTSMIVGLVKIQQEQSLFSKMQALEFSSLMGSGMALLSLGFPIMCNGASLAFRKRNFDEVDGYDGNFHIPSGDDEFLMRKLEKQLPGSVQSIQWSSVVVATKAQASVKSFFNQRLRWAGKWKANDSITTKVLALFMLTFQITMIISICLLWYDAIPIWVSMLLGTKVLLEGYFLFIIGKKLHQHFSMFAFIVLQLLYPFYVVIIGIFSQLLDYEWKGRREKSVG